MFSFAKIYTREYYSRALIYIYMYIYTLWFVYNDPEITIVRDARRKEK